MIKKINVVPVPLALPILLIMALFCVPISILNAQEIDLLLRSRRLIEPVQSRYAIEHRRESWSAAETALIVCDMWDAHHCLNAVRRELEMAPRMNRLLHAMRDRGALIIHAPSSCMEAYKDHPGREIAKTAPAAGNIPDNIGEWCHQIPSEERGTYPIDQSDGGEDDDVHEHEKWHDQLASQGRNPRSPWQKQIELLEIVDGDAISDQGVEIWNLLEDRGIKNVVLVGVHTNMCVLGRPFGLRQMAKNGKNVVLVRDLTDTMYNPLRWPYVSHVAGTDLIIEHIEKYVCPTVTSEQILGGEAFRFKSDHRPHLVCLLGEKEYNTAKSVEAFFRDQLASTFKYSLVHADPEAPNEFLGWKELETADVIFVSVRRRTLPDEQLQLLKTKIRAGTPVIGIRTASHAFSLNGGKPGEGYSEWPEFDSVVLGGNYHMHHGNKKPTDPKTSIRVVESAQRNPLVSGLLPEGEIQVNSWLYKTEPLAEGTTVLVSGRVGERTPHEPVAWTYINPYGARVFYTSLGHEDDFDTEFFRELLKRSLLWTAGLPHALAKTIKPSGAE